MHYWTKIHMFMVYQGLMLGHFVSFVEARSYIEMHTGTLKITITNFNLV